MCTLTYIYILLYIYNICIWWTNMWCQKIKGCPFGLENKDLTGPTEFLKQLSGTRSRFSTAKDPMVWVHWIPLGDEAMGPGTPLAWAPFSKSKFYRLIPPIYFGTASYTAVALYHTISYNIILYHTISPYDSVWSLYPAEDPYIFPHIFPHIFPLISAACSLLLQRAAVRSKQCCELGQGLQWEAGGETSLIQPSSAPPLETPAFLGSERHSLHEKKGQMK